MFVFALHYKSCGVQIRILGKNQKARAFESQINIGRQRALINEIEVSVMPNIISNINPETKTLLTSSSLPSARYWSVQRIIAAFTPQSLKVEMRSGTVKTIVYSARFNVSLIGHDLLAGVV